MSNVVDFRPRRERPPERDADAVLYMWMGDDGLPLWTCLSGEVEYQRRSAVLHAAMFNQLQLEDDEGYHIAFMSTLHSSGAAEREIDKRMFTDTNWRHAWWLWKNAWRNWWFLTKYAYRAWLRPIKSSRASPAPPAESETPRG